MSWLGGLFGRSVTEPVEAVGNVLDKLFTSDEEKLDKKIILERLKAEPQLAQIEVNKVEAGHRSIFVAGWRPFIGWVCGVGLAWMFVINPVVQWATGEAGPELPSAVLVELIIALLGLGALRTFEKAKRLTK